MVRCQFSYKWIGLILLVVCLEGCSTMSSWRPDANFSPEIFGEPAILTKPGAENSEHALVVLRFPAVLEERAKAVFKEQYASQRLSFPPDTRSEGSAPLVENVELEALNKTGYYVFELYQALQKKLPPNTVLLQPTIISLDNNGELIERAEEEFPPSVLYADFFAYVYPTRPMTYEPQTFGDLITPLLTVRTALAAAPTTLGTLVGTQYLLTPPDNIAYELDGSHSLGRTLIDYLRNGMSDTHIFEHVVTARPLQRDKVFAFDLTEVEMNQDQLKAQAETEGPVPFEDLPAKPVMELYANVIVDALNVVDHDLATREARRKYISRIDPELAQAYPLPPGEDIPVVQRKINLLRVIEAAERKTLAQSSAKSLTEIYHGEFGQNMRQQFLVELEHAEKMRSNMKGQIAGQVMGILLAGVGGVMESRALARNDSALYSNSFSMKQSAMQASLSGYQLQGARSHLSTEFESALASVRESQLEYSIKLEGEGVIKIQADNLRGARNKFRSIYAKRMGLGAFILAESAEGSQGMQCVGTQRPMEALPDTTISVTWTGTCSNTGANGYGLALWMQNGTFLGEFQGEMRDGQAQGRGRVVLPYKETPFFHSVEATFANGQPVGPMVVHAPGKEAFPETLPALNVAKQENQR